MHFVGMSAMSLKDPYGRSVEVNYRIDLTLTSLAVVILLCFCGIYVSSRDKVYVSDNEDTVDAFIKDATNMTIQELRAMRHKNYVLFITLFKNMKGIVLGGIINAAGVCVMHYIGEY
jgi:NO-binding membrane sensor protein with MHYT domain